MKDYIFLFDMDSTITRKEVLPEIAQKITDYVNMLDTLMKRWFGREYLTVSDMERDYISYLEDGTGII